MDAPAMLVDSARADQDACDDVPDCAVSYQSARHAATQVTDLLRDDAFAGDPAAGAERATALLSAFQEHGELLDAYLPDLVSRIASLLTGNKQCPPIVDACSLMIYTLCNVRGASTVRQLLPHTVADLTFVTDYLGAKRDPVPWTTQYALMQWLAVCVLVPFQLETILPYADPSRALLDLSITYLCRPVPLSSAAAACTARILSRSDPMANDRMQQFLQRILPIVADANDANDECIGAMTALVQVLKVVPRDRVQQYAPTIADACLARDTLSSSVTVRKLSMKILQRAGLSMMPNSIPSWLYNRGRRSLLHALTWPGSSYKPVDEVSSANSPKGDVTPGAYGLVLDKIYDLVRVESIIARLLAGLSDANTVVRWSSAKGIGRCTMRLGRQLADDIVSSVFDNLRSEPYNADVWHGGLLCLAELIRRGLILPERLHEVIPIVVDGLVFERSRGSHAVGVSTTALLPELSSPSSKPLYRFSLTTGLTWRLACKVQLVALDAATVGLDETQFNAVLDIVLGVSWLECPDEEQIASLQTSLGIVTNASGARLSQTKLYDQSSTLSDNGHYCYSDFVSGLSHP
ncbi:unnamed protein product (mitochondrion) [Plasmodiophora brassicae]|uniref:Tubulin-folding cofactor D ARM repeats domain-containing protein n=1 Tax=Plasmodiophora brassicae TaxID=37360 RepID=A0A3P3YLA0_PLABS|nr:unnamed protein product [Plasmodiophora brassicae]